MDSVINVKINDDEEIEYVNVDEADEEGDTDMDDDDSEVVEPLDGETVLVASGEGVMTIKRKSETVVEHVCGKCKKCFKSVPSLQRHLNLCRHQPKAKAKVKMEKLDRDLLAIDDEAIKENECFCCFEDKSTAHSGCIACNFCPKSFKSHIHLERHLFTLHSASSAYPCTVCNATCPNSKILELHVASHEEGKPFACQNCGTEFTRKYHLDRHLEFTDCDPSRVKKVLLCKVCGKKFTRLDNLREHLRSHLGQPSRRKDYECPYCEKSFYGSSLLNIHIRTHTGERPFPCDLCDDWFPSNGALRKHRRKHTGEKPYSCSVCKKCFSVKETLNRHMKTHTGEKPHACTLCPKSFIQATQLRAHMSHHTGETEFTCDICGSHFNRRGRMEAHMRIKHGAGGGGGGGSGRENTSSGSRSTGKEDEKPHKYTCDVCKCTFRLKTQLALHLRQHIKNAAKEQKKQLEAAKTLVPKRKYTKRASTVGEATALKTSPPVARSPKKTADRESCDASESVQFEIIIKQERAVPRYAAAPAPLNRSVAKAPVEVQPTVVNKAVVDRSPPPASAADASEQQFKCDECDRSFARNASLALHKKTHSRETPVRCKVCKQRFRSLSVLVKHMNSEHRNIFLSMMADDEADDAVDELDEDSSAATVDDLLRSSVVVKTTSPVRQKRPIVELAKSSSSSSSSLTRKSKVAKVEEPPRPPSDVGTDTEEELAGSEYEVELIDMREDAADAEAGDADADDAPPNPCDIPITLSAEELTSNIARLLSLLVDEHTLAELGWPGAACESVLAEVIAQCGQTPADRTTCPDYETVMRENAKLLFTSVISNDSIKSLLNNHSVDEVILHVLKLAT